MKGKIYKGLFVWTLMTTGIGCQRGTAVGEQTTEDSTIVETDTVAEEDSTFFSDDEGLTLNEQTEVFGDFFFAFTHNSRFQAERIRFPLPIRELDGTERTISSGRQFRNEFLLPNNEYYTLLLGTQEQMDIFQSDTSLTDIAMQCIRLHEGTMTAYHFGRTNGQWFLNRREHTEFAPNVSDFFHFYSRFTADSLFQQESLSHHITLEMEDPDNEMEVIEGIIERDQWPMFRPEIPDSAFIHFDFGQTYPNPDRRYFLQCGFSNSMLNSFTFRREGERWMLTAFEN